MTNKYHYTYRITNILINKYYYGSRSSILTPERDIGIIYFSSSTDEEFMKDQKDNSQNYKYKVIKTFDSREAADNYEELLHSKFDVANHASFYNLANMNGKFRQDQTGMISVFDLEEQITRMITVDEFHNNDRYESVIKHKTSVIDLRTNETKHISKEEFDKNKEFYVGVTSGTVAVYDSKLKINIRIPKEEYYNNKKRYINDSTGKTLVKRKSDGKLMKLSVNFDKSLYEGMMTGTITCTDIIKGENVRVSKEEFLSNKSLLGMGTKTCYLVNGIPMRKQELKIYLDIINFGRKMEAFILSKSKMDYVDTFKVLTVSEYKESLRIECYNITNKKDINEEK